MCSCARSIKFFDVPLSWEAIHTIYSSFLSCFFVYKQGTAKTASSGHILSMLIPPEEHLRRQGKIDLM